MSEVICQSLSDLIHENRAFQVLCMPNNCMTSEQNWGKKLHTF